MSMARPDHDQMIEWIQQAQGGDMGAQEQMVTHNVALVKSIVKRFMHRGIEYDDLFQIGCMGLLKAIRNFDTSFDVRFSTYAVPMIMGEIKRFLRDDGAIKVSRSLKETSQKAAAMRETMCIEMGREPTIIELADRMGIVAEDLVFALEGMRAPASLNEVVHEDDDNPILLQERLAAPDLGVVERIALKEMLTQLVHWERMLIIMRYFQDKTQSETAAQLGVSQVQVSRLEAKILRKLREYEGA